MSNGAAAACVFPGAAVGIVIAGGPPEIGSVLSVAVKGLPLPRPRSQSSDL